MAVWRQEKENKDDKSYNRRYDLGLFRSVCYRASNRQGALCDGDYVMEDKYAIKAEYDRESDGAIFFLIGMAIVVSIGFLVFKGDQQYYASKREKEANFLEWCMGGESVTYNDKLGCDQVIAREELK